MNISKLSALIISLLTSGVYASRDHDNLMSSCLHGNYVLFRDSLRRIIELSGKESVCAPYSPNFEMGGHGHGSSLELHGFRNKTFYDAILHGIYSAADKNKHREDARKIMEIMIHYDILGCPGNHVIGDIISNDLGYDLALKALRAGASPLKRSRSVLDYRVFDDLAEGKEYALEFIKEVIAHPEMSAQLQKPDNILGEFAMYYKGSHFEKQVLNLLLESGANISYDVMFSWAYQSFLTFRSFHEGFADFIYTVPNPYLVIDGKGFQDAIEKAYKKAVKIGLSEYPPEDPQFDVLKERKDACYKALTGARFDKPAILCPDGRAVTLKFKSSASKVFVTGTFDSWKKTIEMHQCEDGSFCKDFVFDHDKTYQFKFVADGNWIASDDYAKSDDGNGNVNNII